MKTVKRTVKELERAWYEANKDARAAEEAYETELRRRMAEVETRITADLAPLNIAMTEYQRKASEAKSAVEAAKVEAAKTGDGAPFPLGSRLVKWGHPGPWAYSNRYKPAQILAHGVVEVWTPESEAPDHQRRYGMPSPGDFIVRFLNKDGTPGKRFERLDTFRAANWLPEGQKPKAKE